MFRIADSARESDTGRVRRTNEDRLFARSPLFAVADGMGGAPAGEVASQIAIDVLQDGLPDGPASAEERLAGLVREANTRIWSSAGADAERAGMGTTMTATYLTEDGELAIAHVGDSRLYLLRDGELQRLTRDHSLVEDLVAEGRLTPEEADGHPQGNIVTRALGADADVLADHFTWRAQHGDVYLICSDGLSDMVRPDARIAEIVAGAGTLHEAGRELVDAANEAGGRDNITAVLFRVEEMGGPEGERTMVGATAPRVEDVRGALATAAPATPPAPRAVVERRAPRAPAPAPKKERGRVASALRSLGFFAVFGLPVLLGAFIASQAVYFVGSNDQGFVTLYRGLPYDLPGGISLYSENFVSGVATGELAPRVQATIRDHELRSRKDGADLVDQIELGRLAGQAGVP